jgi:hypothetical protein
MADSQPRVGAEAVQRSGHWTSHRSSSRIPHRNGHRILDWTLTCVSTRVLNHISTLTLT